MALLDELRALGAAVPDTYVVFAAIILWDNGFDSLAGLADAVPGDLVGMGDPAGLAADAIRLFCAIGASGNVSPMTPPGSPLLPGRGPRWRASGRRCASLVRCAGAGLGEPGLTGG